MVDEQIKTWEAISQSILICAPVTQVWKALTDLDLVNKWMSEEEITVVTDWTVDNPIITQVTHHWVSFENKGVVLQFQPEKILAYNHLSSLSKLADEPKNYTSFEFKLTPEGKDTMLSLTIDNFPTESIYKHLDFYWKITMGLLKKFIENNNQLK